MAAKKTSNKGGRRRKYAAGAHKAFHVGIRFPHDVVPKLLALVDHTNDRLEAQGLPRKITVSSLLDLWITQKVAEETEALARRKN